MIMEPHAGNRLFRLPARAPQAGTLSVPGQDPRCVAVPAGLAPWLPASAGRSDPGGSARAPRPGRPRCRRSNDDPLLLLPGGGHSDVALLLLSWQRR
jgi:hypothetical protein